MGKWLNKYLPRVSKNITKTQAGLDFSTVDITGKFYLSNADNDFVFENHAGTKTKLADIKNSYTTTLRTQVTDVVASEFISGVDKVILSRADVGYVNMIQSINFIFTPGSVTYVDPNWPYSSALVYVVLDGVSTTVSSIGSNRITSSTPLCDSMEKSSTGGYIYTPQSDLRINVAPFTTGNGTLRVVVTYLTQAIS